MNTISAGSINERGFINSLDRQGFTYKKSGCELLANLIDAYATCGIFTNNYPNNISLMDDGKGMTERELINMVDIFRENHTEDKSMGVSGMGGSAACFQLSKADGSNPTPVHVYTKSVNDKFLKAIIPWDKIFSEGKFTGQVQISEMNSEETSKFISDRTLYGLVSTGTTIIFNYSEAFYQLLNEQFTKKQSGCDLHP